MVAWRAHREGSWAAAFLAGALVGRLSAADRPLPPSARPVNQVVSGGAISEPPGQPAPRPLVLPGAAGTGPVPVVLGSALGPAPSGAVTPIHGRVYQMTDGILSEPVQFARAGAAPAGGVRPMGGGQPAAGAGPTPESGGDGPPPPPPTGWPARFRPVQGL